MVAIPESGSLDATPLPRLLLDLYRGQFNGRLSLRRDRQEKSFLFQEGIPIFAESNLASETLGVQLMDSGQLSREDHARVSAHVMRHRCREGKALLDLKLLEPKALFVALKDQVRTRLLDCFGWPAGEFGIEPSESPGSEAQPFRADLFALLQEGIECHWSADRVLSDLSPHMNARVLRNRRLSRIQERLLWDDSVQAFIDALDGRCTLWRALQNARTPRALAAAWVLDAAHALDYRDAAAEESRDGGPPEIEVQVMRGAAAKPPRDDRQASSGPASAARRETAADSRQRDPLRMRDERAPVGVDEKLVQEIESGFANLEQLDHYTLLGVPHDAPVAAIRRAYLQAAKRFHPDLLARSGLELATRERAGKLFAAIGRAHAVLSDADRRRDYDASLETGGVEIDAERLAAAEGNFRKGEILMRQGNFRGAVEYLRPAAELWPEEAAYQAALGWALYKKTPSETEAAQHHLAAAHGLEPGNGETAYRLGIVLKALGKTDAGEALQAHARELDPGLD